MHRLRRSVSEKIVTLLHSGERCLALDMPSGAPVQSCLIPWLVLSLLTAAAVGDAHAQPAHGEPALGTSASGLRGLVHTGLPLPAAEVNLSTSAGYGLTEPIDPVSGVHHRGQASLGAAFAPLPWLALALRLDGRLEAHPDDGDGSHVAGFGDPRLFLRAGHALTPSLSIGAQLGLWMPGEDAPSIDPAATSVDGRGLLAWQPSGSPWLLLGALGFRLDNTAHSAPDLARLRLGDRISLGLSSSNALLAAVGVARRLGVEAEVFGELSGDLLVGSEAPELMESPLRVALGGRYFVSRAWQAEVLATVSLSQRPPFGPEDPLVPIDPRVSLLLGLRYGFGHEEAKQAKQAKQAKPVAPELAKPAVAAMPAVVQRGMVAGVLTDERGEPLPDARVQLRKADGEARETISDGQGRYTFPSIALGAATLEVNALGFQTQTWEIDVRAEMAPEPVRALAAKAETGVLRGLTRSFESEPLRAQIIVRDPRGKNVANRESGEDGRFEVELPPGAYRVTISAAGYRPHTRDVKIDGNGVSILNVDMRELK